MQGIVDHRLVLKSSALALALAFEDQGALKLGKRAQDRDIRVVRRRSSRLRASRSIEYEITVSLSWTNASIWSRFGREVFTRGRVDERRSTSTLSTQLGGVLRPL